MVNCPNCDNSELPGALYCSECGAFLLESGEEPDGTLHPFTNVLGPYTEPVLLGQHVSPPTEAEFATFVIPSSGRRVRLPLTDEIRIGRADSEANFYPELDLSDDQGLDQGVSRVHATIRSSPEGIFILDENSSNGTLLNNYQLPPELPYPLHSGDEVRFGNLLVHVFLE